MADHHHLSQQERRSYKRYSNQIWEGHKQTIRGLFLDQNKTYDEVATILAERYRLTVG